MSIKYPPPCRPNAVPVHWKQTRISVLMSIFTKSLFPRHELYFTFSRVVPLNFIVRCWCYTVGTGQIEGNCCFAYLSYKATPLDYLCEWMYEWMYHSLPNEVVVNLILEYCHSKLNRICGWSLFPQEVCWLWGAALLWKRLTKIWSMMQICVKWIITENGSVVDPLPYMLPCRRCKIKANV